MNRFRGACRNATLAVVVVLLAGGYVVLPTKAQPVELPRKPAATRPARNVLHLWKQVGNGDYVAAYAAMYRLASAGDRACELLAGKLGQFGAVLARADANQVARLVKKLGADEYNVRRQASSDLGLLGPWALPYLRTALGEGTSEEVRVRLAGLIAAAGQPDKRSPQRRQLVRAAQVLQWIGTEKADVLLKRMRSWPAGPAADEIDEVAWGQSVRGLQAGLAYEFGRRPYRQGEVVPLGLLMRNVGDKAISLSHPRVPQFVNWNGSGPPSPVVVDAQGAAVAAEGCWGVGIGAEPVRQTLRPGQTATIGRVPLPIRVPGAPGGPLLNVVAYKPAAGAHTVTVGWTFGPAKEGDWAGALTAGPLRLDVVEANAWVPLPPREPALGWGQAVGGIQCRAIVDRTVVDANEPLVMQADLRNLGPNAAGFPLRHDFGIDPEIDGNILRPQLLNYNGPGPPAFPAGSQLVRVPRVIGPLPPGKHIIRAVWNEKVFSRPIEVWVRPPGKGGANGPPAIAPKSVPALRCSLSAARPAWKWWETPALTAELRNGGKQEVLVRSVRVSFDLPGRLALETCDASLRQAPRRIAPAGVERIDIALAERPGKYSAVTFPPGRYALHATAATDAGEARSEPAEFLVLPPGAANAEALAAALRPYEGVPAIETAFLPDATEVVWGEPLGVTFVAKNTSKRRFSETFAIYLGDPGAFGVVATSAWGAELPMASRPQAAPPGRGVGKQREPGDASADPPLPPALIDEVSVEPGETFCRRFRLDAWRQFPGPGRYRVTCRFGHWPIESTFALTIRGRTGENVQAVSNRLVERAGKARGSALAETLDALWSFAREHAAPALVTMAARGDLEHRCAALRVLGRSCSKPAVLAILAAAAGPDGPVRQAAIQGLEGLRSPEAVEAYSAALGDARDRAAASVLRALGRSGCPAALEVLQKAIAGGTFARREAAARGLHDFNTPESMAALARYGGDRDLDFRAVVVRLLRGRRAKIRPDWIVPIVRARIKTGREINELCGIVAGACGQAELIRCLDFDNPSPEAAHNNTVFFHGMRGDGDIVVRWISARNWAYGKGAPGTADQLAHNRRVLADLRRWLAAYDMPGHGPPTNEAAVDIKPGALDDRTWSPPGKAGIRVRLRAAIRSWPVGLAPCLELDIANQGNQPLLHGDRLVRRCSVQLDGKWRGIRLLGRPAVAPEASVPPGKLVCGAVVVPLRHYVGEDGRPLKLAEGDHDLRVSLSLQGPDGKEVGKFESNLVTISVMPRAGNSATATAPAPATVDLTLQAHKDQWDLDLDSNQTSRPRGDGNAAHDPAADVYIDFASTGMPVTSAPHLKVLPLAVGLRSSWEAGFWSGPGSLDDWVRPRWLASQLEKATPGPKRLARLDSLLPRTYAFRTAKGRWGVLQVVCFVDAPRGVRIRYVMLSE